GLIEVPSVRFVLPSIGAPVPLVLGGVALVGQAIAFVRVAIPLLGQALAFAGIPSGLGGFPLGLGPPARGARIRPAVGIRGPSNGGAPAIGVGLPAQLARDPAAFDGQPTALGEPASGGGLGLRISRHGARRSSPYVSTAPLPGGFPEANVSLGRRSGPSRP